MVFRFFEIFQCLRSVAPSFFLIFCNKLDFQKAQRVPPSTILKTLRFLSFGYGADFRRSRLVSSDYNPHTDRSTF